MTNKISGFLAFAIALTALLLPVSAERARFSEENITQYTLASSDGRCTTATTDSAEGVAKAVGVVNGARSASLPSAAADVATLRLSDAAGTVSAYTVLLDGMDVYLKADNGAARKASGDDFFALASATPGFYRYRAIPTAKLTDSANAAVTSSSYTFQKLDGVFYKTQLPTGSAPTVPLSGGNLPVPTFAITPSDTTVKVSSGGSQIWSGTLAQAKSYAPTATGSLAVTVSATFSGTYYKGDVEYKYNVGASASDITFSVDGSNTYIGEVIVLRAKNVPSGTAISVQSDLDFTPKWYTQENGDRIALLPMSYNSSTGEHYVQLSAGGTTQKFGITANNKTFQIQHLTVGESTAEQTIKSQQANDEFNEKFLTLRWDDDSTQHWDGRFVLPVSGARVTTQFGCIRYTNGSSEASRHGGVDLAAATGTRVSAPNHGRVVFAGYLQLTGYTIMIEHGYGLKTWYYHMNSVSVKAGDFVKKGDKIGEVGSTGYSTGPHLHYAMAVNNVYINPYTLTNTDLLA